jgi:hypothetical protein
MELILMILLAGPAGYFTATRTRGLAIYLALWAIVFPVQTVVVYSTSGHGGDVLYWVFNAAILCAGIGLNRLGSVLGERKRGATAASEAA